MPPIVLVRAPQTHSARVRRPARNVRGWSWWKRALPAERSVATLGFPASGPPLTRAPQFEIIDSNDLMGSRMAGNLHVRNLDEELIAKLKRRAARHGRSTEAEHREILRQALAAEIEPSFDILAAELRKLTKRKKQTPSEVLLREGRDER